MVLIAFLLTWVGAGLLALTAFALSWAAADGESLTSITLGQAVHGSPDSLGLPTLLEYYAIAGYAVIAGLLAITTLFAMFNTRANRWIAVLGYVVLAAFLVMGAITTWGETEGRTTGETVSFYAALVVAALMLLFAFFAFKQRAWAAALVGAVVALIGLGMSIWLMLSGNEVLSFEFFGWLVPVGYFLMLLGALCSVATSGQAKMREAEQGRSGGRPSGGVGDPTISPAGPTVSNPSTYGT